MRRTVLLLLALALGKAEGAPAPRDLGQGLVYYRAHALPADLPTGEDARGKACVLDLRFVKADAPAGTALLAWLKFHASAKTPVFLLANVETSAVLLAPLNSPDSVNGLVILGPAAKRFEPDISLPVAAATDRKAYEALETGTPLDSLITEKVDKPRQDEAMLDRDHVSDRDLGDPAPAAAKPAAPAQLIDSVLQRAVQLHRAMVALKRLP